MATGYINPTADARAREDAYKAAAALKWKWKERAAWAQRKLAKAIEEVGHALGLAAQIRTLKATGLEGRRLKAPYKRALEGWVTAQTTPAGDSSTLAERVGDAIGKTADVTLTLLQTEAGQQAVNAALAAAGLPPIPVGDAAASVQDALNTWNATAETPIPDESDPDLAEVEPTGSSSSSSGEKKSGAGWLLAALPVLALLRGR